MGLEEENCPGPHQEHRLQPYPTLLRHWVFPESKVLYIVHWARNFAPLCMVRWLREAGHFAHSETR